MKKKGKKTERKKEKNKRGEYRITDKRLPDFRKIRT